MNETIDLIMQHKSIRRFKSDPIPDEMLNKIVQAGQAASTSSNMQAYSVIAVTASEVKQKLAEVAGHSRHVAECPLLLVWCADLHRNLIAAKQEGLDTIPDTTENFLVASIDAALAAQNSAIAAESLGLGICYIGGLRNNLYEVTQLLNLPKLVYPLFGMTLGYPDQEPTLRPRLPLEAVLHHETYHEEQLSDAISAYDETMRAYYQQRTGGGRDSTWSKDMAEKFGRADRAYLREYLKSQGFNLL